MAENNIDKRIDAVVGEALEDAIENETPIDIEIVSEETIVTDEPLNAKDDFLQTWQKTWMTQIWVVFLLT